MRLVLDTNVGIASVVADGLCRDLVRVRIRLHTLITSELLLDELRESLRTKFKIDPDKLPLLRALSENAVIATPVSLDHPVCRDKDDDLVLATAVAGRAEIIVTGDHDLLVLKRFAAFKLCRRVSSSSCSTGCGDESSFREGA